MHSRPSGARPVPAAAGRESMSVHRKLRAGKLLRPARTWAGSAPAGRESIATRCVAHFDNSARNLNNPDPGAFVYWGDQSWNEMMLGYFEYYHSGGGPKRP